VARVVEDEKFVTQREFQIRVDAHQREHDLHAKFHESEHKMTETALNKADDTLEHRLEGMNEFRAQLEKQAAAFLTREIFEQYTKEQANRLETVLNTNSEKYDAIIKAIVNRHDSDTDSISSQITSVKEALQKEIQAEREVRKTFEGSVNTWKWIATLLGASGIGGVILLLIDKAGT